LKVPNVHTYNGYYCVPSSPLFTGIKNKNRKCMYGRQMDEQLREKKIERQTDKEAKNGQKGD